jgi:hypothetical protein
MAETDPNFSRIESHLEDLETLTELTRPDVDELIRNQLGVTGQVEYTLPSAKPSPNPNPNPKPEP